MKAKYTCYTTFDYRTLYLSKDSPLVRVDTFSMDTLPVTNEQFYNFVLNNPKWPKQKIAKIFTKENYLGCWEEINGKMIE